MKWSKKNSSGPTLATGCRNQPSAEALVASCVPDQATYIGQQFNVHRSLTHGSSVRMHRETVRARRSLTHGSNVYGQRDTVRTSLPLDVSPDYEFRQKWSKVIRKKKFQWPHPRHWLSQPTKRWGFSCCAHRTGPGRCISCNGSVAEPTMDRAGMSRSKWALTLRR